MARRPSTVSVASLASSRAPLESFRSPGATSVLSPPASKLPREISQSGSLTSRRSQDDVVDIEPDELFAKYTIAEVKARQAQLRADAEAKQEDLRIMVGERYRDLLQASSSIISISTSAKRVQEALEETTTAIRSQRVPISQNHIEQSGKDDSHLQMLQVLSAHIKLLLDAPEHLWRLIEREKYFQAAWLFLLARVVHRALIRDGAQDDESWAQCGIDVLEQFPLIQRQWETVSHFRTQIIHRATLSLRLYDKTCEETCATLLTLHILDSRPLAETLTIYLSQRTRTLNALLAKGLDIPEQHSNGLLTAAIAVKNSIRTTLEAISRTLYTARTVFGASTSARSLAASVLDSIQSEPSSAPPANLPAELLLNTQAVLNSLPSSTYVSLLPANIRAYRPFVDLSSVSSSLPQEVLRDKLGSWFHQSTANLGGTFDKWLASLDVVNAVWKVRLSLRKWVARSGLEASEIVNLTELLDEVFGTRITGIWKAVLVRAEKEFLETLASLGSDNEEDMFSPLCSLYHSPPVIQPPPGTVSSSFDLSFDTYKATLMQRLEGRTPRLHEALRTLEDAAASLQKDLSIMFADGESSQRLVVDLTEAYRPEAQALCVRVALALQVSSEELMTSPDISTTMSRLVFYAHVAKELSASAFVYNIGCNQAIVTSFREEMNAVFERVMSCWEEHVVSKLVSHYAHNATIWQTDPGTLPVRCWVSWCANSSIGSTCIHPSPPMMECLYLLSSSIHNLGMSHHQSYLMTVPQRMITKFSTAFVRSIDDGDNLGVLQALYDISFLCHLGSKWENAEMTALGPAIDRLRSHLTDPSKYDPDGSASECLSRTQMLISALLPHVLEAAEVTRKENGDKMAGVLTYGVPMVDSQFVPAVELAPPSSRFPLLLIDAR
ncbi:hypothetical protein J3R83DRAFT_6259 [Lanmaoa asiatica]|nr:hypothetical protein J3R83DRAFT_6259 [Lanmaoa asiatica]